MTVDPGAVSVSTLQQFISDTVGDLKDCRGYCLRCSLDVARWPLDERFNWMRRLAHSSRCERCPAAIPLARARWAWLVLNGQRRIQRAERERQDSPLLAQPPPLDVKGFCPPMPYDPQPEFWTRGDA